MKKAIDAYSRQLKYISNGKEFYNGERKNLLEKIVGMIVKISGNREIKEQIKKEETSEELTRHQEFVQKLQQTDNIELICKKEYNEIVEKEIEYEKE